MSLTNQAVLNRLHITKTTDDLTIGNSTLTELLNDAKYEIGNERNGNILVTNNDNINSSNSIKIDNDNIIIDGNIVPDKNLKYSLGSLNQRYNDIYVGPGSINISGPEKGSFATLGSDNNGIAWTEKGFATPFINVK